MKVVHIPFICILASLIFTSCTAESDNDMESFADSLISFAVDESVQSGFTRGTPLGDATGIPNMGVYAYYTGNGTSNNWAAKGTTAAPNFLNGITVTQNGGAWSYANVVYWPQAADANVSFFAYSPVTAAGNGIKITNTTGVPTLKYTVPTVCTNQPDLLVATPLPNRNKTNNGTSSVNFSFKHALASVGFKLAGSGQKVTSIKMKGVSVSGTLSMDGSTVAWTNLSASASTEFTAGLSGSEIESTDVLTKIMSGDGFLMMIPQTLTTNAELTVTFSNWTTLTINLSDKQWKAGETVWYGLSMPESEVIGRFAGEIVGPVTNGDYEECYYSKTLEIAAVDAPTAFQWSTADETMTIIDLMDGKQNTLGLNKISLTNYPGANHCFMKNKNYSSITSVGDINYEWYLPAQNQLMAVWISGRNLKSVFSSNVYLASNWYTDNRIWFVSLSSGATASIGMTTLQLVRCVKEKGN